MVPGIRVSLFVSGCNHRCPGCFNEQAWDFNFGQPFTQETIDYIIDTLSFGAYQGVTFLGGEPMEPVNQKGLLPLARKIKRNISRKRYLVFHRIRLWKRYNWTHVQPSVLKLKNFLSYIDVSCRWSIHRSTEEPKPGISWFREPALN